MKIGDVFADEVMDFGLRIAPPLVEFLIMPIAPLTRRRHIANRRIEPNVPVVARTVGNLETEIRRGPRDVPITQRFVQEVALQTRRQRLGDDHPDTLRSIYNMGYLVLSMGDYAES